MNNKLINTKDGFSLYSPKHCWDTNYHLIDRKEGLEYLIDIHDVIDTMEEVEDADDYILFSELKSLDDVGLIINYSWKVRRL